MPGVNITVQDAPPGHLPHEAVTPSAPSSQPIAAGSITIDDLAFDPGTQAELDAAIAAVSSGKESVANKGVANGYPSLDATGMVPASQLPLHHIDATAYSGVDATGATESTTGLMAAYAATPAGGTLYVPAGTYLTDQLNWNTKRIRLITDGPEKTIFKAKTGATSPLLNFDFTAAPITDLEIDGFEVDAVNQRDIVCAYFHQVSYSKIGKIKVRRGSVGVKVGHCTATHFDHIIGFNQYRCPLLIDDPTAPMDGSGTSQGPNVYFGKVFTTLTSTDTATTVAFDPSVDTTLRITKVTGIPTSGLGGGPAPITVITSNSQQVDLTYTGVTDNGDGTVTLTGVVPYTTSGFAHSYPIGTTVKFGQQSMIEIHSSTSGIIMEGVFAFAPTIGGFVQAGIVCGSGVAPSGSLGSFVQAGKVIHDAVKGPGLWLNQCRQWQGALNFHAAKGSALYPPSPAQPSIKITGGRDILLDGANWISAQGVQFEGEPSNVCIDGAIFPQTDTGGALIFSTAALAVAYNAGTDATITTGPMAQGSLASAGQVVLIDGNTVVAVAYTGITGSPAAGYVLSGLTPQATGHVFPIGTTISNTVKGLALGPTNVFYTSVTNCASALYASAARLPTRPMMTGVDFLTSDFAVQGGAVGRPAFINAQSGQRHYVDVTGSGTLRILTSGGSVELSIQQGGVVTVQNGLVNNGSETRARTTVADASYAVQSKDRVIAYTSLTASRTVTLPDAAANAGKVYTVKDEAGTAGTFNILFATTSSQTIDGAAATGTKLATNHGDITFYSDGAGWQTTAVLRAHEATHLPGGSDAIDWAGTINMAGTAAGRPAASASNAGSLYFATDTGNLWRSTGSAWQLIRLDRDLVWNGGNQYRESMPRLDAQGTLAAFTSGVMALAAVDLVAGDVITNIALFTGSTALTMGTNADGHLWFALYDPSGNLLAQTADQGGAATWAASSWKSLALTAPQTLTTSGLYLVACMINTGTGGTPAMPTLKGSTISGNFLGSGNTGQPSGQKRLAGTNGSALTTAAPAGPITPSNNANLFYCCLT